MKYGKLMTLVLVAVAALALLVPGASMAEEPPTLIPGYVAGTVSVGDLNISSLSISASGGGFSSSKSVNGNTYSLTVQTGDFDYSVSMNATIRPVNAYYPYTQMYFNNRTVHVPAYSTVQNDYSVVDYGTVRFQLNLTGDAYNSWYIRAYARKDVSPPAERTYSYTYTNSSYSADGIFEMPVVPNQQVRIYAYLYIDGKRYDINTSSYYYTDIGSGETEMITLDITHTAPTTGTATIQGTVDLNNVEDLYRHYVTSSVSGDSQYQYVYENPGSYLFENVQAVPRYVYAYTYMNGTNRYLRWPYGDYYIDVAPGQSYTVDYISDTGVLTGDITFTGTLTNEDMQYYRLYAQGVSDIYEPGTGYVRQPTYGGYSYETQYGTDPDNTYRLILQPGPWQTYHIYARAYDADLGYNNLAYMDLYDYNRYYNGNYYNYGQNADIVAGETTGQDIDYCMGSLLLTYKDASGGLLRNPRVSGSATSRNEQNRPLTQWTINGYSYATLMQNPQVEVHGPDGLYDLTCAAYTEDDSYVTFARFNVELECGVAKGRDIYGPSVTVDTPEANSITNAQSVTVSGTVTDESGVASIEVNGMPANFVSTNNPDDPNEVSFSYDLTVTSGENTITVTASDTLGQQASDSRSIYVDHWMPTVSILSPADGTHYSHVTSQFPLDVQASDQGYGFTLTVSLDGVEIGTVTGEGDDTAPVSVSISDIIQGPLTIGDHVITAVATDVAGNVTTATSTITVYLAADIEVKPEATHNVTNGTSTIFIVLPNGLTPTASLNIADNREITATPDQYPVEVKLSGDNKLTLKFDRTPELMDDIYYTVQGKYCPNPSNPAECYTWQGSDTTNW